MYQFQRMMFRVQRRVERVLRKIIRAVTGNPSGYGREIQI